METITYCKKTNFYIFSGDLQFHFSLCVLGKRLLQLEDINDCHKNVTGFLRKKYCTNDSITSCDSYFRDHDIHIVRGIKGLSSGVFFGEFSIFIALHPTKNVSGFRQHLR